MKIIDDYWVKQGYSVLNSFNSVVKKFRVEG